MTFSLPAPYLFLEPLHASFSHFPLLVKTTTGPEADAVPRVERAPASLAATLPHYPLLVSQV